MVFGLEDRLENQDKAGLLKGGVDLLVLGDVADEEKRLLNAVLFAKVDAEPTPVELPTQRLKAEVLQSRGCLGEVQVGAPASRARSARWRGEGRVDICWFSWRKLVGGYPDISGGPASTYRNQ